MLCESSASMAMIGSPGAILSIRKTSTVTPSKTGSRPSRRPVMYLNISLRTRGSAFQGGVAQVEVDDREVHVFALQRFCLRERRQREVDGHELHFFLAH